MTSSEGVGLPLEKMAGEQGWIWSVLSPLSLFFLLQDVVFAFTVIIAVRIVLREGVAGLVRRLVEVLKLFPGVEGLITLVLRREVRGFLRQIDHGTKSGGGGGKTLAIPEKGLSREELLEELKRRKKLEEDPKSGRLFAYVYTSEDERFHTLQKAFDMFEFEQESEVEESQPHGNQESVSQEDGGQTGSGEGRVEVNPEALTKKEAVVQMFFHAFLHENALNPMVFPSLKQFETEIVAMVASMLHGDGGVVGGVTSGGTESILMAMKTYRDRARHLFPHITHPEVVAPRTIHPAFEKAAGYFDLKMVHVPMGPNYRLDMQAYRKAITPNTILLAGSAPEYCHGIVDPLEEISQIAEKKGLPFHVDSCFGGFMLPWVEKLGYDVPVFDFRLPGVTSMSADIHKYGLGIKGASVVLYRSAEIRKYQIFAYAEWPGGLFGSPGMAGTRPGGHIASSWAVLQCMGEEGYLEVASKLMEVTRSMRDGIESIEGLHVCGKPHMTAFAFMSHDPKMDIFAVADVMESKGWKIERALETLHCTILPTHSLESAKQFVEDLSCACETVKSNPSLAKKGTAGVYGMVGMIPDKAIVKDFVIEFFNEVYTL